VQEAVHEELASLADDTAEPADAAEPEPESES
jgi:hypothetical protein